MTLFNIYNNTRSADCEAPVHSGYYFLAHQPSVLFSLASDLATYTRSNSSGVRNKFATGETHPIQFAHSFRACIRQALGERLVLGNREAPESRVDYRFVPRELSRLSTAPASHSIRDDLRPMRIDRRRTQNCMSDST